MKISMLREKIFYVGAVGMSVALLFFFIAGVWIGDEAKRLCQEAKWEYHQSDCVTALSLSVDDSGQGYRTRNQAIWALGQFGDARALSVLQKHFTGVIPDREPLDESISQYELRKAIALIEKGVNVVAWVWR